MILNNLSVLYFYKNNLINKIKILNKKLLNKMNYLIRVKIKYWKFKNMLMKKKNKIKKKF